MALASSAAVCGPRSEITAEISSWSATFDALPTFRRLVARRVLARLGRAFASVVEDPSTATLRGRPRPRLMGASAVTAAVAGSADAAAVVLHAGRQCGESVGGDRRRGGPGTSGVEPLLDPAGHQLAWTNPRLSGEQLQRAQAPGIETNRHPAVVHRARHEAARTRRS